jgi:hypothetical protein
MDVLPETLNASGPMSDEVGAPLGITTVGPQLAVRVVAGAPVKRTDDERLGHRQDGPFRPSTGRHALVEGGQIGARGPGGGVGDVGQARAPRALPPAGLARPLRARTRGVARGPPCPGRQAARRAHAPPIGAPLGAQPCCAPLVHPGHGLQHGDGRRNAPGRLRNLSSPWAGPLRQALRWVGRGRRRGFQRLQAARNLPTLTANGWRGDLTRQSLTCVLKGNPGRCLQGLRGRRLVRLGGTMITNDLGASRTVAVLPHVHGWW